MTMYKHSQTKYIISELGKNKVCCFLRQSKVRKKVTNGLTNNALSIAYVSSLLE